MVSLSHPARAVEPELLGSLPTDGVVDLTALDWIKPRYSAKPEERAKWRSLMEWAKAKRREQTKAMRETLRRKGVAADSLPEACYLDTRCALIVDADAVAANFNSWPEFKDAALDSWPYVLSYRRVLETISSEIFAPAANAPAADARDRELLRRFTNDQLTRAAFDGVPGKIGVVEGPLYSLYEFGLTSDLRRDDGENIVYAMGLISEHGGWLSPPDVGVETQEHLWALVQHGDDRPDLQYDALIAMQRHFGGKQYPRQYGFLYDRVMLKLTGKQRYGTQVACVDGIRKPQPLEEGKSVDKLRSEIGLPSLDTYMKKFPDCSVSP